MPLFRRAVLGYCAYTARDRRVRVLGAEVHRRAVPASYARPSETANYYFGARHGRRRRDRHGGRRPVGRSRAAQAAADHRRRRRTTRATNKLGINALLRICAIGMVWAAPLDRASRSSMPTPIAFFAFAFVAEIGLFLSTSPVNAIGLRAVPPELRASAMAAMIFAIHLFGDLWSPSRARPARRSARAERSR